MQALNDRPRGMRWKVVQRAFWVHGVDTLQQYLATALTFTLDGRTDGIRCPTLLTMAENDRLAEGAPALLDRARLSEDAAGASAPPRARATTARSRTARSPPPHPRLARRDPRVLTGGS